VEILTLLNFMLFPTITKLGRSNDPAPIFVHKLCWGFGC